MTFLSFTTVFNFMSKVRNARNFNRFGQDEKLSTLVQSINPSYGNIKDPLIMNFLTTVWPTKLWEGNVFSRVRISVCCLEGNRVTTDHDVCWSVTGTVGTPHDPSLTPSYRDLSWFKSSSWIGSNLFTWI